MLISGASGFKCDTVVVGNRSVAKGRVHNLCRFEGIIPALESSHALAHAAKIAPQMDKSKVLLVNLSGRGDKDIHTVAKLEGIVV